MSRFDSEQLSQRDVDTVDIVEEILSQDDVAYRAMSFVISMLV